LVFREDAGDLAGVVFFLGVGEVGHGTVGF
jgi:hypothetical protein